MSLMPKVIADPEVCHGKPVIAGTRVMVWQILELLESGKTSQEIYAGYPTLPLGAVEAALHFAADRVKSERYVSFTKGSRSQVFA